MRAGFFSSSADAPDAIKPWAEKSIGAKISAGKAKTAFVFMAAEIMLMKFIAAGICLFFIKEALSADKIFQALFIPPLKKT